MATAATDAGNVLDSTHDDATRGRRPLRTRSARMRALRWLPLVAVAALGVGLALPVSATNLHRPNPSEGLICTNGNATLVGETLGTTTTQVVSRSFVLTARDGYISTNDGNSIYMWSYAEGDKDFQYPGPFLCANEGDRVTVTLRNTLKVPTSIVFTGIPGVKADGVVSQPDGGTSGPATSLTRPAAPGSSVTYTFTAAHPGTFEYASGTDPQLQMQMGMVGGLIVRPSTPTAGCAVPTPPPSCVYAYNPASASNYAYDTLYSGFNTNTEFVHLFTEVDPDMHHWIELGNLSYDWSKYNSRYFLINGRCFPDDLAPNNVSNLPTQPYGALVHLQASSSASNRDTALVRYLNAGPVSIPFHAHGNHEQTVGIDGHELVTATGADASIDRFDIVVAPGQTVDALFSWVDAQNWQPDTNPVGVPVPDQQDRLEGPYWNGTPYLGDQQPLATGRVSYNECGEFYHFAHDHDLIHITSFGISGGGGQLTLVRVDPPPSLQAKYGTTCTVPGR
jgi:hypothetical protein